MRFSGTMRDATPRRSHRLRRRNQHGQSLVEYSLILVLVAIAIAGALVLTGPAIGNVFSNAVSTSLTQGTAYTPYYTLNSNTLDAFRTAYLKQVQPFGFITNTPAGPTCSVPANVGKWQTVVPASGHENDPPTFVFNC